ncbi:MAG: RNA methyltransferase [Bacteroidetes bacterium]|nr:RNA methyltransferase [Bacteroidota bacterium]
MEKLKTTELNRLSVAEFRAGEKFPLVLILDQIRSGLNVGSIFRTADAFALEELILAGITAQPPHREILKTALGSTETVRWRHAENTLDAVLDLKSKGYRVFALEQTSAKTWLHQIEASAILPCALILGNEVDGVDEMLLPYCDGAIEIPQYGSKHSLNVAVACGIAVWEFVRKR